MGTFTSRLSRWAGSVLAIYAILAGSLALLGWFAGIPRLTDWLGTGIAMFSNTALAAICCGAALLLANVHQRWAKTACAILGVAVLLLGAATLLEHIFQLSFGIDNILIQPAWGDRAAVETGRMGPPASASYTLLGLAILLLSQKRERLRHLAPFLGIIVSAGAVLSLMGYLFGADPLFALAAYTGIAMQTSTVLLALGLGVVAGVPQAQPMRTVCAPTAAGVLARRSIPFILGLPLLLGWLRLRAQQAGYVDTPMGLALLMLTTIGVFSALLAWWLRSMTRYEQALAQARILMDTTVASIGDAVIITDQAGRITFLNREAERLTGWNNAQAAGLPLQQVFRIINEHTRAPAENPVDRVVRTGTIVGLANHTLLISKDGREIPIDDSAAPIRHPDDPDGPLHGVVLVFRDFSERKRAETALRQSEEKYRLFFNNITQPVVVLKPVRNAAGNITDWAFIDANRVAAAVAETAGGTLIDRTVRQVIPQDDVFARLLHGFSSVLTTGQTWLDEIPAFGRQFLACTFRISDHAIAISGIDITERKRAEASLRESELRYRTLFEVSLYGVITIDEAGIVQRLNPAAEELFGYKQHELVGKNISMVMPDPDQFGHRRPSENSPPAGPRTPIAREVTARRSGGSEFPMELAVSEFSLAGKRYFKGVVNDITERKLAETALRDSEARERAARGEAERANRMKDDFLATLSHELRTPLNAILGWSRLIENNPADADTVREGMEVITRNAKAQAELIADLLDMSRIVSGKLRLQIDQVDLPKVLSAAVDAVRPAAQAKAIRIEISCSTTTKTVRGDAGRLQQVVWNLLSNAIKFTPNNGSIQVTLQVQETTARIVIHDTGMGIKPEFLPHLFGRFRQADASMARQHGGLGLGLAIVKSLVEMHGGTVRAESPGEDKGSTFTVELPLTSAPPTTPAPEMPPGGKAAPTRWQSINLQGIRVLAIDDHHDSREMLFRVLQESQADVKLAASADEGLLTLKQYLPHIILCDIGMPGRDGYDFIRELRTQGNQTPALAVTAFALPQDRAKALEEGFQGHIAKPIEPGEVITAIAAITKGVRPQEMALEQASDIRA